MLNAVNNITPLEAFGIMMTVVAVVGGQLFSLVHQVERRLDGQQLEILEIKVLGVKHNGWPHEVILEGLDEAMKTRGQVPSLIEQLLKRGE